MIEVARDVAFNDPPTTDPTSLRIEFRFVDLPPLNPSVRIIFDRICYFKYYNLSLLFPISNLSLNTYKKRNTRVCCKNPIIPETEWEISLQILLRETHLLAGKVSELKRKARANSHLTFENRPSLSLSPSSIIKLSNLSSLSSPLKKGHRGSRHKFFPSNIWTSPPERSLVFTFADKSSSFLPPFFLFLFSLCTEDKRRWITPRSSFSVNKVRL